MATETGNGLASRISEHVKPVVHKPQTDDVFDAIDAAVNKYGTKKSDKFEVATKKGKVTFSTKDCFCDGLDDDSLIILSGKSDLAAKLPGTLGARGNGLHKSRTATLEAGQGAKNFLLASFGVVTKADIENARDHAE